MLKKREEKYKTGDLVKLRSGGPVMTVQSLNSDLVRCLWFAGKKLEEGYFQVESLEPADKEEKKQGAGE